MELFKRGHAFRLSMYFIIATVAIPLIVLLGSKVAAQSQSLDPRAVRAAAFQAGLDSLRNVVVNDPGGLTDFVRTGSGPGGVDPVARQALIQLGKAFFWDRQVGSDGQACASCHFVAFADNRTRNQLSPNLRNTDPQERVTFDQTASGGRGPRVRNDR